MCPVWRTQSLSNVHEKPGSVSGSLNGDQIMSAIRDAAERVIRYQIVILDNGTKKKKKTHDTSEVSILYIIAEQTT